MDSSGETKVSASIGKTRIVAFLRTSTVDIGTPPAVGKNRRFAQCTYARFPCVLTGWISILVNENEIFIPRSAYSDLGDITSAEVSPNGNLFVLTIKGGDASESYIARLVFDKERVLERRLYSGEDPQHATEVSRYYLVGAAD
jgi:hypothetical protein